MIAFVILQTTDVWIIRHKFQEILQEVKEKE